MDRREHFPMTSSREPNPLRPYYIPPSIGEAPGAASTASQAHPSAVPRTSRPAATLHSTASDLLPDITIDLRSSAGEAWTNTRTLLDALAWRYASCLMAQPFDVAKTILQVAAPPSSSVGSATPRKARASPRRSDGHSARNQGRHSRAYESYSETDEGTTDVASEDDDMPDYFTSNAPRSRSPRKRRRITPSPSPSPDPTPTPSRTGGQRRHDRTPEHELTLKRPDSVTHVLSTMYNTSGALGLWRATNCTFLYSVLLRTTDSFVRSLLLAVLGLPDLGGPDQSLLAPGLLSSAGAGTSGLDITDAPSPVLTLAVVGLASCLSGLLLAPLDLIRVRLIVTPTSLQHRGILSNLKRLPSLLAPSNLWLPTALLHSIPQTLSTSIPQLLRRRLRFTPENSPSLWSIAAFSTSLIELFVRLPLETITRRAQVQALRQSSSDLPFVVETAPYLGVGGTVYSILYTEGETKTKDAKGMVRVRKGQGVAGLVRGWRIGFWGLVGVWGAGAMGAGAERGKGEF
ncbi:hypothetical protein B0A48_00726 [Cryoendolithus antarcticus]|uniref:Mitochondrial carrier n=1 Tax=Cryoendolithus antarcticus TaxID=1507870 RepID=A0A1V8TVM3_9PEZI|nr:hypothetical protein B0A48_00726 [Cryoendolithus antarcticus]